MGRRSALSARLPWLWLAGVMNPFTDCLLLAPLGCEKKNGAKWHRSLTCGYGSEKGSRDVPPLPLRLVG